ncbi:uncharacterized protein LOC143369036 [Andrena cerasifolii]|uniref:uncharacterized protein LOC143369036 n=1 Tax=Andrena cerasifolii TaxID=2819439 RepID=UPI0040384BC2
MLTIFNTKRNLTFMKMTESCDPAHADKEFNITDKSKDTDAIDEPKEYAENQQTESIEINDCTNTDVDVNIPNETTEKDDANSMHKCDEPKSNAYEKSSKLIDSDSEGENMSNSKSKEENPVYNSSDGETFHFDHNVSFKKHLKKKNAIKKCLDSDSEDASSIVNGSDDNEVISNKKKIENITQSRLQTLIDSESEEENERQLIPVDENKELKQEHSKSKIRKVSLRAAKEEAMRQIHSETRRLVRESEISLPYHRPKQRTLQEFLSRKKVFSVLPKAPTMAAKLKMSSAIVDKVLKEKEKEAEIFYKSSDSEEEERENLSSSDAEDTSIKCTQVSKKDIVSRKLFDDNNFSMDNDEESMKTSEASNATKEVGCNKSMVNDITENNATVSAIQEIHCDTNNAENEREVIVGLAEIPTDKEVDELLQKRDVEVEDREDNLQSSVSKSNDDEKNDPSTAYETSDVSTSKSNDDYASIVKRSLGLTTEESDEYNEYGLPPPTFDGSPIIHQKEQLLNIKSLKPRLRGAPGTIIDLSDGIKANKKGINSLIDRFVCKHSITHEQVHDASDVTALNITETPSGVSIVKETLPYKFPNFANEDTKLQKPGAKLTRLKEELKHKMALKRDEEWKQKEQDMKEQEIEWNESINEEDGLSEPYSPSIESYISKEDELEDDLYTKKEKKKSKCAFVDDEAEVSDDAMIEDEDENVEEDEGECESVVLEDDDDSTDVFSNRKPFKRIVHTLEDDSRSCSTENNEDIIDKDEKTILPRTTISTGMFNASEKDEASDNEGDIPVSQVHVENDLEHRLSQTPQAKTNSFNFISPVTQLTALNIRLESEGEPAKAEQQVLIDEADPFLIEDTQTKQSSNQTCDFKEQAASQRKLFTSQKDITDEELMQLCSGNFMQDKSNLHLSEEPSVTESQLLGICSGTFNTQVNNTQKSTNDLLDESSLHHSAYDKNQGSRKNVKPWNTLSVVSSDDEDPIEKEINKRSRKKVKKLDLSEDEDEEDNASAASSDEEDNENDAEKYIDYDSEENEVVVPKKSIKQYATTFLDEEAELSESDCDVSADEDEKDLDKLEYEEGDDEDVDETQMKNQLGKLHMKQMLDEDQNEVRMLKELLFEDGDLYSESARERKFKWRNIDKQDDNNQLQPSEDKDGWVDVSDDEDEAKWRKVRHEREKFLAEKMINVDTEIENDLNNSQIFKLGMKVLKRKRVNETERQDTLLEVLDSTEMSRMPHTVADMLYSSNLKGKSRVIHNVMQKRSFLARGQESLSRLAALTRQKDDKPSLTSVSSKNFVFAHIDPSAKNGSSVGETKAEYCKVKRKH